MCNRRLYCVVDGCELKVIEELTRRLQKSDDMREHHLHEIHALKGACIEAAGFLISTLTD